MSSSHPAVVDVSRKLEDLARVMPSRMRALVSTHGYPDPDALASAAAFHLLLERRFNVHSRIVFSGQVSRAENREFLRHFRYHWSMVENLRPSRRRQPAFIVDVQPGGGHLVLPSNAQVVGVLDHHPITRRSRVAAVPFADVRPGVGATVSILHQYLEAAKIVPPPWLATCMVYAILTETADFTRAFTPLDREAYLALLARAHLPTLGRIIHAPQSALYFAQLKLGLENARVYGRIVWTHLEEVDQPEIVSEMADYLLHLENITWSFCTAFHKDHLMISLRSRRREARCGDILHAAFAGDGSAGGHHRMAAGSLPVAGLDTAARAARLERLTQAVLQRLDPRRASESARDRPLAAVPAADPSNESKPLS